MNQEDHFRAKMRKGCCNPLRHRMGRPPPAPYLIGSARMCRGCLELRIAEGPTTVRSVTPPQRATTPGDCNSAHAHRTRAALSLDGLALCWPCADLALIAAGRAVILAALD